jgi:myo-inositol 2-dehydrogenase/D-chiro-inositol 1-dehydrogenase
MNEPHSSIDRRQLLRTAGAGALGAGFLSLAAAPAAAVARPARGLRQAPDGAPLKAGLVGCGGRGSGAVFDFLAAGPNLTIAALADVFEDRLVPLRERLKADKGIDVPKERCFLGFDAYQKLLETDVDVVLLATPPHFRPEHFRECVRARKHVFMEKPVAVDPVGARSVMASARKADVAGLSVVTGTQRRHQASYQATYERIAGGAIGDIVSANCYWNQGQLWYRDRQPDWSDMEFMIRDWVNWCWLSGDHITEQHVHNLDVIHWFTGRQPVKAVGTGSRQRRVTGDQYDAFSIDFDYGDGLHVHSMCRQVNGCANNVSELVVGTKGWSDCHSRIVGHDGKALWTYEGEGDPSPYVQEHIDLVTSIRKGEPFNEAENTAVSTLMAVMGRVAAYTGREVGWEEMMGSDLRLGPDTYAMGPIELACEVPVPGT